MSDRTEKAHKALADACDEWENDVDAHTPKQRIVFLLDVAHTQALLAQAEAYERIADYHDWLRKCYPLGYQPTYPAPQQVTPFRPWVGPNWASRSGLDHENGNG